MEDIAFFLFIPTYLLYLYWIKRSSAWGYAVLTSILWGPFLHGHVLFNVEPIMLIGSVPISEFITEWMRQFFFFNFGGILFSGYVAAVWGINRGKIALVLFSLVPTIVIIPLAIIYIIGFHLVDIILFQGRIHEKLTHTDRTAEDYVL